MSRGVFAFRTGLTRASHALFPARICARGSYGTKTMLVNRAAAHFSALRSISPAASAAAALRAPPGASPPFRPAPAFRGARSLVAGLTGAKGAPAPFWTLAHAARTPGSSVSSGEASPAWRFSQQCEQPQHQMQRRHGISTVRKRKLKMKKHQLRKRRKKNRSIKQRQIAKKTDARRDDDE